MTIRDRGPTYQMGYGVTSRDVTRAGEQEGIDPNAGFISKALHGHPFMRFLAVSASTLVGIEVAGALVRKGGVRLATGLVKGAIEGKAFHTTALRDFRKTQDLLDRWQGLTRVKGELGEDILAGATGRRSILEEIGNPQLDKTSDLSGFQFTREENLKAASQGLDASAAHWTMRDEIQKHLVRQARRLPYELPAAYAVQRGVTDRLFGENQDKAPNWSNPVDVLGDFASQSLKTMGTLLLPLEVGKGAAAQTWRTAMNRSAEQGTHLAGLQRNMRDLSVGMDRGLRLLGHDAGELLFRGTRKSQQFTGAFSASLDETTASYRTPLEKIASRYRGMRSGTARRFSADDLPGGIGDAWRFSKSFRRNWKDLGGKLDDVPVSTGRTSLERLTKTLGQFSNKQSDWYQKQLRGEYRTLVEEEMRGVGIGAADADRFSRIARFRLPSRELVEKGRPAESSVAFGDGPTIPGDSSFAEHVKAQLTHAKDFEKPDLIARHIEAVSRRADERYVASLKSIRQRVDARGLKARTEVIGRSGDSLGSDRLPYNLFEAPFSPAVREQLTRMSARQLGISTQDDIGGRLSTGALKPLLGARGVDAADPHQMRALLVQSKKISAPWRPEGRNIFGLRRLSGEEAMKKGFFGDDTRAVGKTLDDLQKTRTYGADIHRTPLKGVYETASGKTLDLNVHSKSFWNSMDLFANEFQVPLIHFRPFQAMGYQTFRDIREAGPVMLQSGTSSQPFTGMSPAAKTDSYMWFRQGRGMKGKVVKFGDGGAEEAAGRYRPMPSDASQFVGRALRQASGDPGRAPAKARNWFQRGFNIDEDQPNSLFRFAKRFRERKTDTRNLQSFSRMLHDGDISHLSKEQVAGGTHNLITKLRQTGYTPGVVKELTNAGYGNLVRLKTRSGEVLDFPAVKDADEMEGLLRKLIDEDETYGIPGLGRDGSAALRRKRGRLAQAAEGSGPNAISDAPVASNVRSASIHRRLDEFRNDVYQYLAARHGLASGEDMNKVFGEISERLSKMKSTGALSSSEVTEARAALLSTQVNFEGFKHYESGITDQDLLLRQAASLLRPGSKVPSWMPESSGTMATSPVLGELAEGGGLGSTWRQFGRKTLGGVSDYQYPGTRYNSFGADNVFVPTFGTTVGRVGVRRALSSTLGVTTWNDPNAFSGAGIPLTHGFTRLNNYMSTVGLGLDTSAYAGPLDYYARGLIAKRVLPIVGLGTSGMMVDRQLGGMVNEKDPEGNRVYSPLFMGIGADVAAQAQIGVSAAVPGGASGEEKAQELFHGETAVRRGRWWALGNTPWKGGNEQYFRPSWYRRLKAGTQYTDQAYGSPMERLAFGFDFSPLRPLDPYRFEREHQSDRPYPMTGEYFTGPWGPLTSALNLTVGKVLKPRRAMHEDEVAANLASYTPVGEGGMAPPVEVPFGPPMGQSIGGAGFIGTGGGGGGRSASPVLGGGGAGLRGPLGAGMHPMLAGVNAMYTQAAAIGPSRTAAGDSRGALAQTNSLYMASAGTPAGPPKGRVPFGLTMAAPPMNPSQTMTGQLGYELQETLGIYGFAFATVRESLTGGDKDFIPQRPVLASAGGAYGSGRGFWDLNLGGMGDAPTPVEGEYANLEFGEIIRRFVPKPRRLDEINPIANEMGWRAPFLPSTLKMGDPFASIPEGELRLPGTGYDRSHAVWKDESGQYGLATQHAILGDTAPWSEEYTRLDRTLDGAGLGVLEMAEVERTRSQVAAVRQKHDFTPYEHRYTSALEMGRHPLGFGIDKAMERVTHADTFLNRKFLPVRTATEDWERNNVYGATFPQWQNPIQDYLKPMAYKAADRGVFTAGATLGLVGGMFWRTQKTKQMGRVVGAVTGAVIGGATNLKEVMTGERFIPETRRKELAIEEYADILSYTRSKTLAGSAAAQGDDVTAAAYQKKMKQTMYGADLYGSTPEELALAIPKRKREHFMAMLDAPEQERARILSTAPRLERRIYEAAWGQQVEKRPELEDYFGEHELPGPDWEGWDPSTDMETVKLKMIQSQGLDAAQMGYYPQQVQQANLINPAYPDFQGGSGSRRDVEQQLRILMANQGVAGSVTARRTPFPGTRLQVNAG